MTMTTATTPLGPSGPSWYICLGHGKVRADECSPGPPVLATSSSPPVRETGRLGSLTIARDSDAEDTRTIGSLVAVPLTTSEWNAKRTSGFAALVPLLDSGAIPAVADVGRPSAIREPSTDASEGGDGEE